ncbi:hypothetical protein [Thiomicrorhabdus indica]|uniref:hypothetical protein n=1 Tax=Thiomicrorhabdus indica TaxID=2267253 RepID=UPI00102D6AA6|nr:hypothetical protein [Thiomicrorhabdus indica]
MTTHKLLNITKAFGHLIWAFAKFIGMALWIIAEGFMKMASYAQEMVPEEPKKTEAEKLYSRDIDDIISTPGNIYRDEYEKDGSY